MRLFRVCLENRDNVALVWRDVGMLIIQGRDVKMRFYTDFLKRLNGTDQSLQAVLEMPEMRDSVISRHDTAASQTSSGRVIVLPGYKLETVPKMPTVKADLTGHVKAAPEKGWGKGNGSGKKEWLLETTSISQGAPHYSPWMRESCQNSFPQGNNNGELQA
ncbi:coiled-coil domain-containing protein 81-like [Haliaeetus albicilla]|uniref:coiled-coil domain-containing protein 81-like n=1 Tax=Haliaeetus albicilla TaxID=8969 RepID=UPI0037E80243